MWHIITFLQHCHQKIFKQLSAVTLRYLLYLNVHSYEAIYNADFGENLVAKLFHIDSFMSWQHD